MAIWQYAFLLIDSADSPIEPAVEPSIVSEHKQVVSALLDRVFGNREDLGDGDVHWGEYETNDAFVYVVADSRLEVFIRLDLGGAWVDIVESLRYECAAIGLMPLIVRPAKVFHGKVCAKSLKRLRRRGLSEIRTDS
ncbi:MAG: hypothetical protein K2W85_02725 [Phycisphaerales bacterium]|nr:hypothetical protein [Phycisphaerales bacterium]